jgi:hypothetical protein
MTIPPPRDDERPKPRLRLRKMATNKESEKKIPTPKPSRPASASTTSVSGKHKRSVATVPSAAERAKARFIKVPERDAGSIASIAECLPAVADLAPDTMVIIDGEIDRPPSLARSVLAVFGNRGKRLSRPDRCTALVARGFVRVGAATDEDERLDLAWGHAPARSSSD